MNRMRKWIAVMGISCLFCAMASQAALAEGGHWVDLEKGPGGARWVDENGNETTPPAADGNSQAAEEAPSVPEQQAEGQQGTAVSPEGPGAPQPETAVTQPEGPGAPQPEAAPEAQPEAQAAGRVIDPSRPMVALTFDDGPQTEVGNQIMDCLAAYGGKATFFVVGERCPSRAAELQRMVAEGHEVANHSYDHKYFNKLSGDQIQSEVNRANDVIQAACGVRPTLVRLPGGNINNTVRANVNYPMIMWSIDTLDWKTRNTQNTVNVVLSQVQDGDIVLMHELYSATGAAALQIIPELTARGYQLVTVSEMAQARGVVLEAGKTYSKFRP